MSLLDIHTWSDGRAMIHVAAPVAAGAVVAMGWADDGVVQLVVAIVLAVTSPLLALANTRNGFRQFVYPVIAAVAALLIGLGYFTHESYEAWLPIVVLAIGPAVAAANTPTSASTPVNALQEPPVP